MSEIPPPDSGRPAASARGLPQRPDPLPQRPVPESADQALPPAGYDGVIDRWEYLLAVPAALTLLALVGLTFADVLGRYFLDRPVRGATELVELAMVIIIFLGLPLVTRHGEHIALDFLDRFVSARVGQIIGVAMSLLMAGCLFWLAWLMAQKAIDIGQSGDVTMVLSIPLSPFIFFIAAAAAIDGCVNLGLALWRFGALRRGGAL